MEGDADRVLSSRKAKSRDLVPGHLGEISKCAPIGYRKLEKSIK